MRMLILLLLLCSPVIWAHETISGDIHAVVNPDGSISYYLKVVPGTINKIDDTAVNKATIKQLVGGNKIPPKVFEIMSGKKETAGYYVTSALSEKTEPVEMAIDRGYTAKAIPYESLPESFNQLYKLTDKKGELGGAWLPASEAQGVSALGGIIPSDWSTSKVRASSKSAIASARNIPVPREDFIESLRESMLRQAISLACKSKVVPKEIAVTASLAASVGFIVGGEGTISFQATWETTQLCKPISKKGRSEGK